MKNYYVEQGVLLAQAFAKDDTKSVEKSPVRCWPRSRWLPTLAGWWRVVQSPSEA